MKFMQRAALALAGLFALSSAPALVLAHGQSGQSSGSGSDTGAYGSGSQGSMEKSPTGQGSKGAYGAGSASKLSSDDRDFIYKASQDNQGEVDLAKLAEQKASSSAVRSLARSMLQDHEKVQSQLKEIASSSNLTLPTAVPSDIKTKRTELSKLSGADFDRQFIDFVVDAHEKDISAFQKEAQRQDANPKVQKFASSTVPQLEMHLTEARNIQKQVSGKSGAGAGGDSTGGSTGGGY
jgi:putative membrane protein